MSVGTDRGAKKTHSSRGVIPVTPTDKADLRGAALMNGFASGHLNLVAAGGLEPPTYGL
jgi:hypothetical protein